MVTEPRPTSSALRASQIPLAQVGGMDAIVVGGPSLLRAWTEKLLSKVANALRPRAEIRVIDFASAPLSDLGTRGSGPARLILTKEPPAWLLERIAAGHVPTIAILEDPLDAVAYSRKVKGCTLLEGVRDQSAATASALAVRDNASVTLISRNIAIDARQLANEIFQIVGWPQDNAARESLIGEHGGTSTQPLSIEEALAAMAAFYAPPIRPAVDFSSDEEAAAVSGALDPLTKLMAGTQGDAIVWPAALLLDGDDFVRPAQTSIDLTGPARNLVRGPYLCLPPGRYNCRYVMRFSPRAAKTRYALEVHGKHLLAEHRFTPASEGTMALDFALEIDDPSHWIDLRFRLAEGTIEGHVTAMGAEWRLRS